MPDDSWVDSGTQAVFPTACPDEFAQRIVQAYLHPDRSPMVIKSMFYSALLHLRALPVLRGAPKTTASDAASYTTQQLCLKGSVMNQIRQKLPSVNSSNIHENQVEDIVMSILHLAANENVDQIRPPESSPSSPPLRRLQLLEFYGGCEFHPLHWQTVKHIMLQRGRLA